MSTALALAWSTLALVAGVSGHARAQEGLGQESATNRQVVPYVVTDDAITEPLAVQRGDPALGEALIGERHRSLCILCHALPSGVERLQGTLAPSLAGIGSRLSEGQIRLRIVDMKRLNPESIMPTYHALPASARIAPGWQGKPVLGAAEIEHLVAYLVTLKE
ncbi:sulfur-oxidizing protein SoxX [Ancylobacter aquaticus]|uniref:Sulfur-oxidizing protein SoxX n=1 Tax=Ancylobacter aquaticus TaxID=100 RepID=A0A4R1I2H5_ANCAQ|nr:sulfur oxidation c-type cytochrome SoxX [Ancylobacter aquaticus]TCK28133.1 sulfur-oxidizing protein SoxX [Ancylobacter aquaticus]